VVLSPLQRTLFFVLVIAAAALVVAVLVATVVPDDDYRRPESATYRLDDLTPGEPVFFRPFDMGAQSDGLYGIWLVRLEEGEVLALFSRDRFRGQAIGRLPTEPSLDGPTFGSDSGGSFTLDGHPYSGPGARGLDRFPTAIDEGVVHLDLTRLILGECNPSVRVSGPFRCSRPSEEDVWEIDWTNTWRIER